MLTTESSDMDQGLHIFDLAPFPMWIYDLHTYEFLAVNDEMCKQYGYTEDELLSMTIKDIRPEEDIPMLEKAVEEARNRKGTYKQSLFRHAKKSGEVMMVQLKSNLIEYEGKKAEIVVSVDLTQRHEQEQQIKAHQDFLQIIGEVQDLLLKADDYRNVLSTCFDLVGKQLSCRRMGLFLYEIIEGSHSHSFKWVKEDKSATANAEDAPELPLGNMPDKLHPLLKGKHIAAKPQDFESKENYVQWTDGVGEVALLIPLMAGRQYLGYLSVDCDKQGEKDSSHEIQILTSLASNLAFAIKEDDLQRSIMASESRLRALVENAADMIAVLDTDGTYTYVAPVSAKVLGIPPESFIGKNAFEFINEEDVPLVRQIQQDILHTDRISFGPYRYPDAHGNWRWLQTDLSNHLDNPHINGLVANTRDVTTKVEQQMEEDQVAQLTKAIAQPGSLSECFNEALSIVVNQSNICASEIWLAQENQSNLILISKAYEGEVMERFYEVSKEVDNVGKGQGLPGAIWEKSRHQVWDNLAERSEFIRSFAVEEGYLLTAVGTPITFHGEFLGCIIGFYNKDHAVFSNQVRLFNRLGPQLGAPIKQKLTEIEYRNFFELSSDPHCVLGFDGTIKKMNRAFREVIDFKEEEIFMESAIRFVHEDDRAMVLDRLDKPGIWKDSPPLEMRVVTKNGDIRWLTWTGTVIPEAKIVLGVAKDITFQKRAEERLKSSNQRLRTAQRIAKLGYWSREIGNPIGEWSEETYRIYGCSPEDFKPTLDEVKKLIHPDDRHLIDVSKISELKPGQPTTFEHRIITPDGEQKWVTREVQLRHDENGNIIGVNGTIQDITERKVYEEKLAISKERFELAMKASHEILWEIDHLQNVLIRSTNHESKLNFDGMEPFSKSSSIFTNIHPEDKDRVWDTLQSALENPEAESWHQEFRVVADDGSLAYFVDRCYILRDEKQRPMRTVGSLLDVTKSRQQMQRIKEQNEALRDIAWMQSHVIRAPLARMMGLISIAEHTDDDRMSYAEVLKHIMDASHELDDVIKDITLKVHKLEVFDGDLNSA